MNIPFVILFMLFMHVLDDYGLQGILASMKQREWWVKNAPDKKYKYDYIVALLMHSLSWTFMIMLPIAIYVGFNIPVIFIVVFAANILVHAGIDNMKANDHAINLIVDQIVHVAQIAITAMFLL